MPLLLTFQAVIPISETRNQLMVMCLVLVQGGWLKALKLLTNTSQMHTVRGVASCPRGRNTAQPRPHCLYLLYGSA